MRNNTKIAISSNTNIKVVNAEKMLIASLLRSPEFYSRVENDISQEDFTEENNKRIFCALTEKIKEQRSLELTFFAQDLTPEQMDWLVRIEKDHEFPLTIKSCLDCISVIKQEQERKKVSVPLSDLSDEEFRNLFRKNQ